MRYVLTCLIFFLGCLPMRSQQIIYVIPNAAGTVPGEVCFVDTNNYPGSLDTVCLKAPANVTTPFDITLPAAPPTTTTRCLEMTTGGVLQYAAGACGVAGAALPVPDTTSIVEGSGDDTKELRFEVDGFTTGTVRTLTPQNASYTIAGINIAQTFSANQTLADTIDLLCATDGGCDIATNTTRIGIGYADVWNAQQIGIIDSAHSLNWTIEQASGDTSSIEFNDGTRDLFVINRQTVSTDFTFGSGSGTFEAFLIPHTNAQGSIGTNTVRWETAYIQGLGLGSSSLNCTLGTESGPYLNSTCAIVPFTGEDGTLDLGLIGRRWATAYLEDLNVGDDILPETANNSDIGASGNAFNNIFGNFFKVRSAAGTCTIVSGSGAPSGGCTTCDMALRTDGGAGATLYVCEGGSWAAK